MPKGFASMNKKQHQEVSSKGGKNNTKRHKWTSEEAKLVRAGDTPLLRVDSQGNVRISLKQLQKESKNTFPTALQADLSI